MASSRSSPTIVLVHGGFVDGSGWFGVYKTLRAVGHEVLVVQNPTQSLDGDVEAVRAIVGSVGGPVLLVGHSYGGVVITEAGSHPDVQGLVFVSAFVPDAGDTIQSLLSGSAGSGEPPPIEPAYPGFLRLDRDKFRECFAADVEAAAAAFMADSQVPWGEGAIAATVSEPAWKKKPSWYIVSKDDRMIPPDLQRMMAERANADTIEIGGSHCAYITHAEEAAGLIARASTSLALAD